MNKKDIFDSMLEDEQNKEKTAQQFIKQLNREINKKVYKKSGIIVTLFIVIAIILYFSTSTILNIYHYNPVKDNVIQYEDGTTVNGYHMLMTTFVNTFIPGVDYIQAGEDKSEGFSAYTMEGQFNNRFDPFITGEKISKVNIQYSKLKNFENKITLFANQFYDLDKLDKDYKPLEESEEIIKQFQEMPKSANIDMTFTFKNKMDIEDFLHFKNKFKDSNFIYMASYVHDSTIYLGLTTSTTSVHDFSEEFNEKYPSLQSIEAETKEEYERKYSSSLQFLLDHPKFIRTIDPAVLEYGDALTLIQEELDKVKKEGLSFKGVRVYASRDDAIALLKDDQVIFPMVMDAKFSGYDY